jgi:ankyrin repeat protein
MRNFVSSHYGKVGFCLLVMLLATSFEILADPMHVAVRSLDTKMFYRLIEQPMDLTATDSAGMTALHHACALGAVEMVQALLEKGAVASQTCNIGNNALHYSVSMDALCADPEPPRSDVTLCPLTIPDLLASTGIDLNAFNNAGEAALHIAARNGLVGVIATLLKAGADPNIRNRAGETPLHLLIGPMPHLTAQVLLLNGADLHAVADDGSTPLERAKATGNLMLINMLVQYHEKEKR